MKLLEIPLFCWGRACLALAIAAFVAAFDLLGGPGRARLIAFAALIVYLVFMASELSIGLVSSNIRNVR